MEVVPEDYRNGHYLPSSKVAKLQDCKMAAVFEDKRSGTIYYEYTENEVQLKNLANPNPVAYRNAVHSNNATFSSQPRLHAYDYQLYGNDYIPHDDHFYDMPRSNYPYTHHEINNTKLYHENELAYQRSKNRNSRNSTRSRSKSVDRKRKKLPLFDNFSVGDVLLPDNEMAKRTISRNRNLSAPARDLSQYDLYNGYRVYPAATFPTHSSQEKYFSDFNHGAWSHCQRSSRNVYQSSQAFLPPSPLDSGLSSQSVPSSPSLDAEPIHFRQIPECGSPIMVTSMQRNHCSCSTNSCSNSNALCPPIRNDSGRSSPWAQTAVLRLNALTEAKNFKGPFNPQSSTVTLSTDDFDQKRYSMSGLYVTPQGQFTSHASHKAYDQENKSEKNVEVKNALNSSIHDGYGYISNKDLHDLLYRPQAKYVEDEMVPEEFNKSKFNSNGQTRIHDFHQNGYDISNVLDSSISLTDSTSPTEMYLPPTSSKNDSESRKSKKRSSKSSEKAICELEEMYNKLNLQDCDLLDRAERRDLPTVHQVPNPNICGLPRSKSDSFFEILGANYCNPFKKPPRAPPLRRSGVPDLIADDMALRKLQKPDSKPYESNDNSSYMLYSSHFTPSLPIPNEAWLTNIPDIEYDDYSFRRYFHLSSGKVSEPQPPFGIPLNPNPPQSVFSDYMHVVPTSKPYLCHPRRNPDVVRDDLAFRSLRKDNPERAMYDSYSLFCRKVR